LLCSLNEPTSQKYGGAVQVRDRGLGSFIPALLLYSAQRAMTAVMVDNNGQALSGGVQFKQVIGDLP
jgi:hypothetical protein